MSLPQDGSFPRALLSPTMMRHLLALVIATFILRSSERNPMGPPCLLDRTQEKITMSFSRPWLVCVVCGMRCVWCDG
jgi:phosphopantetheinyl transferase